MRLLDDGELNDRTYFFFIDDRDQWNCISCHRPPSEKLYVAVLDEVVRHEDNIVLLCRTCWTLGSNTYNIALKHLIDVGVDVTNLRKLGDRISYPRFPQEVA